MAITSVTHGQAGAVTWGDAGSAAGNKVIAWVLEMSVNLIDTTNMDNSDRWRTRTVGRYNYRATVDSLDVTIGAAGAYAETGQEATLVLNDGIQNHTFLLARLESVTKTVDVDDVTKQTYVFVCGGKPLS